MVPLPIVPGLSMQQVRIIRLLTVGSDFVDLEKPGTFMTRG